MGCNRFSWSPNRFRSIDMKKYIVTLTGDERRALSDLISAGKASALKLAHARILLQADAAEGGPAWHDDRSHAARRQAPAPLRPHLRRQGLRFEAGACPHPPQGRCRRRRARMAR